MGVKGKGRQRHPVMEGVSARDERLSTGNTVDGTVMVLCGDRWQLHVR